MALSTMLADTTVHNLIVLRRRVSLRLPFTPEFYTIVQFWFVPARSLTNYPVAVKSALAGHLFPIASGSIAVSTHYENRTTKSNPWRNRYEYFEQKFIYGCLIPGALYECDSE
jgi:hypothetical protein